MRTPATNVTNRTSSQIVQMGAVAVGNWIDALGFACDMPVIGTPAGWPALCPAAQPSAAAPCVMRATAHPAPDALALPGAMPQTTGGRV